MIQVFQISILLSLGFNLEIDMSRIGGRRFHKPGASSYSFVLLFYQPLQRARKIQASII